MFCVQCGKKIENEDAESKKKEKYLKREKIEAAVVIIGTAFVLIHDMF